MDHTTVDGVTPTEYMNTTNCISELRKKKKKKDMNLEGGCLEVDLGIVRRRSSLSEYDQNDYIHV